MKKPAILRLQALNIGAAGRNRTHDPLVRSPPKPNVPLQKQRLTAPTPCSSAQSCWGLREPLTQKSRTHYRPHVPPWDDAAAVVSTPLQNTQVLYARAGAWRTRSPTAAEFRRGFGESLIFLTATRKRPESRDSTCFAPFHQP